MPAMGREAGLSQDGHGRLEAARGGIPTPGTPAAGAETAQPTDKFWQPTDSTMGAGVAW